MSQSNSFKQEDTMIESASLARVSRQSQVRAVLAIASKDWLHFVRYPLNAVFRVRAAARSS